jgi:ABC-type multidrug transport system fused ATPase/permease subunit
VKKTLERSKSEGRVKEFMEKFMELRSAFMAERIVEVQLSVLRVVDGLGRLESKLDNHSKCVLATRVIFLIFFTVIEERLKDMRRSRNARFDRKKICLPSTRLSVLEKIFEWISSSSSSKSILLIHGMAGTGKSTIANTIAKMLSESGRLGASYCFSRDDTADRNAENMFSTIAIEMAQLDKLFGHKLGEAVEDIGLRSSSMYIIPKQVPALIVLQVTPRSSMRTSFSSLCAL